MPIGMPGWPDFAASTASMASARIELASSASEALAVTEESIGSGKLYSAQWTTNERAPFPRPAAVRGGLLCRAARRRPLVRVLRRQAAGRAGAAGAAERRCALPCAPGLRTPAVAQKPQYVGLGA